MNFDEYQQEAARTASSYSENEKDFYTLISVLGLVGEAGEVADYLKKVYGHGHTLDHVKLKKEIGDLAWYCADICTKFGYSFNEVVELNLQKLRDRYPNGFERDKSINRKLTDV